MGSPRGPSFLDPDGVCFDLDEPQPGWPNYVVVKLPNQAWTTERAAKLQGRRAGEECWCGGVVWALISAEGMGMKDLVEMSVKHSQA